MKILCLIFLLISSFGAIAQNQPAPSSPDFLDFWIGGWRATWSESDSTQGVGYNYIDDIMHGTIIEENFVVESGQMAGFEGRSLSLLDAQTGTWKQTWVDNQNSYLDFDSKLVDGNPCFFRYFLRGDTLEVFQRMVFRNITEGSFTWDWESSLDGGKTWTLNWQIKYVRDEH